MNDTRYAVFIYLRMRLRCCGFKGNKTFGMVLAEKICLAFLRLPGEKEFPEENTQHLQQAILIEPRRQIWKKFKGPERR